MNLIYWPDASDSPADLGGKATGLLSLPQGRWLIPPWFVLRPSAFQACWDDPPRDRTANGLEPEQGGPFWAEAVARLSASTELRRALERLCPANEAVAVRSSALVEDGMRRSFAGQFETFLNVQPGDVADRIVAVWKSALSERVRRYRQRQLGPASNTVPAVLVQQMVAAEVSGVIFTADPVTGRRGVSVISACYGLGTALVNGENNADSWKTDRQGQIIARTIGRKSTCQIFASHGIQSAPVPEAEAVRPALTDPQIQAIAAMAQAVAHQRGCAQDLEWATQAGQIYLLQARPITTLRNQVDPDGRLRIWDNSNITESYSGVTTPLTFTFACRAYEGVYRQFCRLLAVPSSKIAAHQSTFCEMLGLIQGRVYYNLFNWYRVLSLLPGFTVNRRFMEQMMGVKEPLPAELLAELDGATFVERLKDSARLLGMCGAITAHYLSLPQRIRQFQQRLDDALQPPAIPLEQQRADELAGYFLELENKLLIRWDAPLLNDFFTMVFCGVLRALAARWCEDTSGTLLSALLSGRSDITSAEPAKRIAALARLAGPSPELVRSLQCDSTAHILAALEGFPQIQAELDGYLARFGDRCLDELKLESPSLIADPLPLLRSIGRLAALPPPAAVDLSATVPSPLSGAEKTVARHLRGHPIRSLLFRWVLRQARARTRDRENLRFERTRLFGRVRQIFVQIGQRLAGDGCLDNPRDIFFLEVNEVLGFLAGTATATDLAALTAVRKSEFERHHQAAHLPQRLTTHGSPYQGDPPRPVPRPAPPLDADSRQGTSCCPGIVRGRVRIVTDPRQTLLQGGEILVAEQTDPGWILLFPGARGLLVERGSLLSHSAIVARELQIPTIVAIPNVTRWLKDGDAIEMDGGTGFVHRLKLNPSEPGSLDGPTATTGGGSNPDLGPLQTGLFCNAH